MNAEIIPLRPRRRYLAVSGGKGGVGRSTLAVNLAACYAKLGHRTLLVDGDFGMADLNLLLGLAPKKTLADVIEGSSIAEALIDCHGFHFLPSSSACFRLANPDPFVTKRIHAILEALRSSFETTILDTPSGIETNAMNLTATARDVLIAAAPEPTALADAYATMKVLSTRHGVKRLFIVPNRVRSPEEGEELAHQLTTLVDRFLDAELVILPSIPHDARLGRIALTGAPLVIAEPDAPASRAIARVARALDACSSFAPAQPSRTEARL